MGELPVRERSLEELELNERLRQQLGLGPDEPVRLLDAGVRTILLERCGAPASAALPWDHELVFTANVRAFPLADLLGVVHSAGKSGFLFFTCRDHTKSVFLHRGEVVFASSNQRVDRLGECLLRAGVITLEQLREAVLGHACDLGIAFDGDGDRIGVLDGKGRILWGDQFLVFLAKEVLSEHPGATIIADVKASQVLFDEIARMGGRPLMWRTGHSLIKAKMAETGAPLAGEMSGHIFFADRYYGYDDALYAAVRLLNVVARESASLAELVDRLPRVVNTPELRIPCSDERKFKVIEEVKVRLAAEAAELVAVDGVRVKSGDGWWLLRASNTQAALVARCEAPSAEALERLKSALRRQLAASGVAVPAF